MSMCFCKQHQQSFSQGSQCPDCTHNAANRPYRGMNRPVILDRQVIRYTPARKDAAEGAMVSVNNKQT